MFYSVAQLFSWLPKTHLDLKMSTSSPSETFPSSPSQRKQNNRNTTSQINYSACLGFFCEIVIITISARGNILID